MHSSFLPPFVLYQGQSAIVSVSMNSRLSFLEFVVAAPEGLYRVGLLFQPSIDVSARPSICTKPSYPAQIPLTPVRYNLDCSQSLHKYYKQALHHDRRGHSRRCQSSILPFPAPCHILLVFTSLQNLLHLPPPHATYCNPNISLNCSIVFSGPVTVCPTVRGSL